MLLLCSWGSWKLKDGWLSLEISSLFFYPWGTFIFYDLGEDSSSLKRFPSFSPCSLISKKVSWASVAQRRPELWMFDCQESKVWIIWKVCLSTSITNISALRWATDMCLTILKMGEQGLLNGKRFRELLSLPESWKLKEVWESWISDNFSTQKSRSVFCILRSRGGQEEAETFSIVKVMISHFQNGKLEPCSWSGCWDIYDWSWGTHFQSFKTFSLQTINHS